MKKSEKAKAHTACYFSMRSLENSLLLSYLTEICRIPCNAQAKLVGTAVHW